jgi:hypothetical protein
VPTTWRLLLGDDSTVELDAVGPIEPTPATRTSPCTQDRIGGHGVG